MQELKYTSDYTSLKIHQMLYLELQNKLIMFSIFLFAILGFWWYKDLNWWYVFFPILINGLFIAQPIADILEFGSERLLCELTDDTIITIDNYHVPLENIESVEFLAKNKSRHHEYDIALVLKTSTKVQLFIEVPAKHMYQIHNHLKLYLDMPYIYLKDGYLFKDKVYTNVRDIL